MTTERKIRLDVAYDGTDFAGWQVQPGLRTVQGILESVLSDLSGGLPVAVRGSGRTDSGVHARHQVADCWITSGYDDDRLGHALRRMLPRDLRPLRVRTVPADFHARAAPSFKTYVYRLDLTRAGNPFLNRFALHYRHRLDLELVGEALSFLPGRRDWSGFAASSCTVLDRTRDLTEARLELPEPGEATLVFTANGFLHHMVRNIVGTLLEVGGSRKPMKVMREVLKTGDRNLAGPTAPACGLCLMRVRYPGFDDDTDAER